MPNQATAWVSGGIMVAVGVVVFLALPSDAAYVGAVAVVGGVVVGAVEVGKAQRYAAAAHAYELRRSELAAELEGARGRAD